MTRALGLAIAVVIGGACTSEQVTTGPIQQHGPGNPVPRVDGRSPPPDDVADDGAPEPDRLGPPDTVVLQIYAVADDIADPFAKAPGPAPRGVQIMTRSRKGEASRQVAHVNRIPGEPVRTTLTRARPWFAGIELPEGHRFVFSLVTGFEHDEDVDAVLVEPDPIEVRLDQTQPRAPDRDVWIDVSLTEPARRHLQKMTAQLVGRQVAFVVADRVLWDVRLNHALGERGSQTLGVVRDPAVAEQVRRALRGDADAREALAEDTITNGGSWDDIAAKREADKLPDPVTVSDGTTKFFVGYGIDDTRVHVRANIPAGWPYATTSGSVVWNSSRTASEKVRTIRIEGWSNNGGHTEHLRSIAREVVDHSKAAKPVETPAKTYPRVHEVVLDETDGPRRLFARAVRHPEGVPPGLIFDRVEAWCYVTQVSDDYYLRAKITGPAKERNAVLQLARDVCGSLQLAE